MKLVDTTGYGITDAFVTRADYEQLEARAERAEKRIRKLALLFGVPDGGQYYNDWKERADILEAQLANLREALDDVLSDGYSYLGSAREWEEWCERKDAYRKLLEKPDA